MTPSDAAKIRAKAELLSDAALDVAVSEAEFARDLCRERVEDWARRQARYREEALLYRAERGRRVARANREALTEYPHHLDELR